MDGQTYKTQIHRYDKFLTRPIPSVLRTLLMLDLNISLFISYNHHKWLLNKETFISHSAYHINNDTSIIFRLSQN